MSLTYSQTYILFVNDNDGVTSLDYNSFRNVLDHYHEEAENLTISRGARQSYRIRGRDGRLDKTVARKKFPDDILENIKDFYKG